MPHHALLRYRPLFIYYHAFFLPIFNTHDMAWVHFTDAARYFPFAGTVAFSFEPL